MYILNRGEIKIDYDDAIGVTTVESMIPDARVRSLVLEPTTSASAGERDARGLTHT